MLPQATGRSVADPDMQCVVWLYETCRSGYNVSLIYLVLFPFLLPSPHDKDNVGLIYLVLFPFLLPSNVCLIYFVLFPALFPSLHDTDDVGAQALTVKHDPMYLLASTSPTINISKAMLLYSDDMDHAII